MTPKNETLRKYTNQRDKQAREIKSAIKLPK